jgi:putative SOS response-associated peptidase YedK
MCYHKSLVARYEALMEHYSASFDQVYSDLGIVRDRYSILMSRDDRKDPYNPDELKELKRLQKIIDAFTDTHYKRYHENGFDYLPAPIVTTGAPNEFRFFYWGLVPFYMGDQNKAMAIRAQTLNCISEEMYDKPSFKDAAKNGQRCLIPVTGFYEWRWIDEKGKSKVPYFVSFKDQPIASIAGLYSRWKNKATGDYYYSYTVLTTQANLLMEYIHNNKKRMPVFIPKEYEKDWLNRNLSKEDVLALCRPLDKDVMRANTISKLITTKDVETNVEEVLKPHVYTDLPQDQAIPEL